MPLSSAFKSRYFGAQVTAKPVPLPENRRLPFGWSAATIGESPVFLDWPGLPTIELTHLRITVALDGRDEKLVEAFLLDSGRVLGSFDVRYACIFQIYEIAFAPADIADIRREGVGLRLVKGSELRIFSGGTGIPSEFLPHLMAPGGANAYARFFARLGGLASVQAFGWQEGCVLDGLLDLAALPQYAHFRETARAHLAQFVNDENLTYESPRSEPRDGAIYGIEGTLPFAALAQLEPENAVLALAVQFWQNNRHAENAVIDGQHTSSEGAYTVGYPLAVLGKWRDDEMLQQLALTQLRVRHARLFDGQTFWRTSEVSGHRGDRNWARGVAWQLLGGARTLRELHFRADLKPHIADFQQLAEWSLKFQREDGLWSVFVDEPELSPDTGGSAGIAAALAIGANEGWLNRNVIGAAQKTLVGLRTHLTNDGFLGGVSQGNKGGETLQRSDYRVIYQMGMGLMAQLIAALEGDNW